MNILKPPCVSSGVRSTALCALATLGLLAGSAAYGQTPPAESGGKLTAPQLFPEKTLAYLRIDNVKELKEAMGRSSLGKLSSDDQIRPILAEFYGSLVNSTEMIRERLGLNLDELLSIPTGELAVALLPADAQANKQSDDSGEESAQNRRAVNRPSVAIMMDAGDEISGVQVVLDRVQTSVGDRMTHEERKLGPLTLHLFSNPERAREQFGYFIDQGVFIACSDLLGLERLAQRWSGGQVDWPPLAENRRFTTIMSRCVGTQGERPQISFFADPLALFRQLTPSSGGANLVFAMLPALGLNDIQAVGGSSIIAPPDFDSIAHFHILLGTPRRAVLALVRPKSGSTMPEDWVPASVSSYSTINWDLASTMQGVEQLYDQFQSPGAMKQQVFDRISQRLQLDFQKDILDSLEGRLTMVQGLVRPIRLNSASNVYAIRVKNPDYFSRTVLPKLIDLVRERQEVSTENFGRFQVQVFMPERMRESPTLRQPEICVTMIEDYLVISDSRFMMTEITSSLNSPEDRLSQALEFQMISDRIKSQLQDKQSAALFYSRPEESLQMFYELARDPANRDRLRQVSANNGFFKALLAALDNHKLPDFSVIAQYLAPSGGFMVEEENGLHYTSFTLRRE